MDAVTAIMNDHRVLEGLFERLKTGDGDRTALVAEVKARLKAHSVAEEEHVYPALEHADPDEADEVHHGVKEHREAEEKLTALETAMERGQEEFHQALTAFVDAVTHHVDEEESDILPALKDATTADRLQELGAQFEDRRVRELQEAGIDETLTKDELYQQAREADISGRSTMSKAELQDELRKQRTS